ncbi:MAG: ATP-binding cassette domain-containing protein [Elusimicrobiota bacterium]|jgi:iron complex transport system ATP-binding protein|nr:ATP-binding cassette domain-containing protein [Elusimicrobiota bacterium]
MANPNSNFIEFQNTAVIRGDRTILDIENLVIGSNENTAIIGPNGSGKSTLIKLITAKIYPSWTGDNTVCKMFGQNQWNVADLRSQMGIVTNELQYDFHNDITGLETIMSGFFASIGLFTNHKTTKEMRQKAQEISEFLEISHLNDKYIDAMSSGEARRFLIARALVHKPKVLVLDEPSNSLDIASVIKFHATIKKILNAGTRVILVTHFISDIIPEISRFVLLKDGKIFADGSRKEVFTSANLSSLFNMKVELIEKDGLAQIVVK